MNSDFDPKKNITKIDYFLMQINRINRGIIKINDFVSIKKTVRNWPDVLFFRLGLKKSNFTMELRNGFKVKIKKPEDYFEFFSRNQYKKIKLTNLSFNKIGNLLTFKYKGHKVKFYCPKEKESDVLDLLLEEFVYKIYDQFDCKNKIVVNVGGNIGDSALFFALEGAKHVYMIEPFFDNYKIALKNIKLNEMHDFITPIFAACASKDAYLHVSDTSQHTKSTEIVEVQKGKKIKTISLKTLVTNNKINHALLEMDCEGCEYDLILESSKSVLDRFDYIILEYHYGAKNILKKLNNLGFTSKHTPPIYFKGNTRDAPTFDRYVGLIFAKRK